MHARGGAGLCAHFAPAARPPATSAFAPHPCSGPPWRSSSTTDRRPPTTSRTCWGEAAGPGIPARCWHALLLAHLLSGSSPLDSTVGCTALGSSTSGSAVVPEVPAVPAPLRAAPSPPTPAAVSRTGCRRHEGEGSAFALLKARGWATGLVAGEAGTSYRCEGWCCFGCGGVLVPDSCAPPGSPEVLLMWLPLLSCLSWPFVLSCSVLPCRCAPLSPGLLGPCPACLPACLPACSGRSFFMCRIDLTDEGHAHAALAAGVVFRWASGLPAGEKRRGWSEGACPRQRPGLLAGSSGGGGALRNGCHAGAMLAGFETPTSSASACTLCAAR